MNRSMIINTFIKQPEEIVDKIFLTDYTRSSDLSIDLALLDVPKYSLIFLASNSIYSTQSLIFPSNVAQYWLTLSAEDVFTYKNQNFFKTNIDGLGCYFMVNNISFYPWVKHLLTRDPYHTKDSFNLNLVLFKYDDTPTTPFTIEVAFNLDVQPNL